MPIIHSFRALYALNVPKEVLLLVVIWTHLEAKIFFFFFYFSATSTTLQTHTYRRTYLSVSQTFGSSVLVRPAEDQNLCLLTYCDLVKFWLSEKPPLMVWKSRLSLLLLLLHLMPCCASSMNASHHSTCSLPLSLAPFQPLTLYWFCVARFW